MEHLFRIAFWICTLSGCLQAMPIPKNDFQFEDVRRSCVPQPLNATFYSPTNVEIGCITTALDCFKSGLVDVKCTNEKDGLSESLTALIEERLENGHGLNSTECACQNSTRLPFNDFLKEMESVVDLHFSSSSSR